MPRAKKPPRAATAQPSALAILPDRPTHERSYTPHETPRTTGGIGMARENRRTLDSQLVSDLTGHLVRTQAVMESMEKIVEGLLQSLYYESQVIAELRKRLETALDERKM
jgi:hypothetical protein